MHVVFNFQSVWSGRKSCLRFSNPGTDSLCTLYRVRFQVSSAFRKSPTIRRYVSLGIIPWHVVGVAVHRKKKTMGGVYEHTCFSAHTMRQRGSGVNPMTPNCSSGSISIAQVTQTTVVVALQLLLTFHVKHARLDDFFSVYFFLNEKKKKRTKKLIFTMRLNYIERVKNLNTHTIFRYFFFSSVPIISLSSLYV